MRRNQPEKLEPLNPRKSERYKAPSGTGNDAAQDGYSRLSTRDPFYSGSRQPIGGQRVYPSFKEDC